MGFNYGFKVLMMQKYIGLFKMIVWVLTTRHNNTLEIRVYVFFLFNRTTLQVFVTWLTGTVFEHPL